MKELIKYIFGLILLLSLFSISVEIVHLYRCRNDQVYRNKIKARVWNKRIEIFLSKIKITKTGMPRIMCQKITCFF